jgi:hypothetical protein
MIAHLSDGWVLVKRKRPEMFAMPGDDFSLGQSNVTSTAHLRMSEDVIFRN